MVFKHILDNFLIILLLQNTFLWASEPSMSTLPSIQITSTLLLIGTFGALGTFYLWIFNRRLQESEERFKCLHNASFGGIAIHDKGIILDCNQGLCELSGYTMEELVGKNGLLLIAEDFRETVMLNINNHYQKPYEAMGIRKNGQHFPVRIEAREIPYRGKLVRVVEFRDISEEKLSEEKLRLAASVFVHAKEAIMITNTDGIIIDVNDSFSNISGYSKEESIGKNANILSSGRHSKEFYEAMWHDLLTKDHWYGEIWNRRKNGEVYVELLTISAIRNHLGKTSQYMGLFSDITLMKQHEKQLEHIAHHDALTNLPNRLLLADRLHQGIMQTHRRGQLLVVVYIDLDGFKAVNDQYGHEVGDKLLVALSEQMKFSLREDDTLARLGGDEFVAVLQDMADIDASIPMLERLLESTAKPIKIGDLTLKVSASLGVTFYPQEEEVEADQLLRQADQAMYQAKLSGKNRYHIFDAKQDRNVRGHHEEIERIRHALHENEFVLHYQPKVNMLTGELIGVEALVRWQHPQRGLIRPAAFLPLFENHPLAIELGNWVLHSALAQIEQWNALGITINVSVNISAHQLEEVDFTQTLRTILMEHQKVSPSALELEILETSALEDVQKVSHIIHECKEMGIHFALDDFGTGYCSLTYLQKLPVALLKIDQSFVHDMLNDTGDIAILEGILGLAKAFGRDVIAEGIETIEQGVMLLKLGCTLGQGYIIAHPMSAEEFPQWLATWKPDPAWTNLK